MSNSIIHQKIRIIADIHGNYKDYLKIISGCEYSIQLGDFGFDYSCLNDVDSNKHKIVAGNHSNYDKIVNYPHYLGDFGTYELGGLSFFFIRGAYSVDKMYRMPGVSWWSKEELTWQQGQECIELFKEIKPELVLSHDCPFVCHLAGVVTNNYKIKPSLTTELLQACWHEHHPKNWIFGHHHNRGWQQIIGGTHFRCLGELEYYDYHI